MALPMRLRARRYAQRELSSRSGAGGIVAAPVFVDNFTTADDAPMTTPRQGEPGPDTWTVVGTDQSVSGGNYVFPSIASQQGLIAVGSVARADGLVIAGFGLNFSSLGSVWQLGWRAAASLGSAQHPAIQFGGTTLSGVINAATPALATIATGTAYDIAIVTRAAGCFLLYKLSSASLWTLLYVDDINNSATLYRSVRHNTAAGVCSRIVAARGWAVPRIYYSASGVIGVVNPPTADFVAKMRCTGTASQALIFRRQDANNYWRIIRGATTFTLVETIAGVDQAAAASGVIVAATGDRIEVAADGTTIRLWHITSGGTVVTPTAVTGATNFATATGMAVSDEANYTELEVYNRTQSGPSL